MPETDSSKHANKYANSLLVILSDSYHFSIISLKKSIRPAFSFEKYIRSEAPGE